MNFSDFVFSATEIAAFDCHRQRKRIWEATNNRPDNPQTWQFRYDPLFIPEINNNQLVVRSEQWKESSWITTLTILLDNEDAGKIAYQTVYNLYPEHQAKIQRSSIFALPIAYVKINIPELKQFAENAKIVNEYFKFAQVSKEFTIKIESPDKDTALKVEKGLSSMTIEYEFSISARKSSQNTVKFSLQKLKQSNLFIKLGGLGNITYVHRDDLRKLIEGIHTEVVFDAVIEKPDHFEAGLLEKLLTYWNQTESSKNFDETKWQSTYNQDDLKPSVLTKELNKIFTKDEHENQWKFNPTADISADAGALTQIKGKIAGKLSLSNDELKKLLKEQNIEANIEGTKIEAKSIDLHQVNLADFNDQTELISVVTFVEPIESNHIKGSIDLSRILSSIECDIKNKIIVLFGKSSVGKSTIFFSLIGTDISESLELSNFSTIYIKPPLIMVDIPGGIGDKNYEELAIEQAKKAHVHIFVVDGEPYMNELEFFEKIHNASLNTPKIVFVNKWDMLQNSNTKKEQETIRSRISEKMRKFIKYSEDIVYGSAVVFDKKRDELIRQELPQLSNKIKELF